MGESSTFGVGGRFNFGRDINKTQFQPFNALYIAETHNIAMCEKYGITGDLSIQFSNQELALAPSSHQFVRIKGKVHSVLDVRTAKSLRKVANIIRHFKIDAMTDELATFAGIREPMTVMKLPKDLKTSIHERDWKAAPTQVNLPATPQVFGKLVYDAGIEGILYNSTKGNGSCLALFPKNFDGSESFVMLEDDSANTVLNTKMDKNTWRKLI